MDLELLTKLLGWIFVINLGILFFWFFIFMFAKNWIYNFHGKWFSIPVEKMDIIHYSLMGAFKLLTLGFFLAPYLALRIVL